MPPNDTASAPHYATPMDSLLPVSAPHPEPLGFPPELSSFRPLPYISGQQQLCPNCFTTFASDSSFIRYTNRCTFKCLATIDMVAEENREELEVIIHARLLEQEMEANIYHAVHAFNSALACEKAKIKPLLPSDMLRDALAHLDHCRELLEESMLYTTSEEERLRGGKMGVIQHLLSREHQEGLPVWLRGVLPLQYTLSLGRKC